MILIHPSSLGKIMTEPTAAAKKAGDVLSQGAKTYLKMLAKEHVYGFKDRNESKYTQKGIDVEEESIALFNLLYDTDFEKHHGRIETELLSGECDILAEDCVIDIKSSWSLSTFPATPEDAHNHDYEWQGRAYMHLYDRPQFILAYCMVSTPDELCKYEQPDMHMVGHIPIHMRVTTISYERDMQLEDAMLCKCRAAQAFIAEHIERIKLAHKRN